MAKKAIGTKEWAPHNANCCLGCPNDCKYCYARWMACRFGRATPATWKDEHTYLHKAEGMARRRKPTRIMFPTTHDITPGNLDVCLEALELMLGAGHEMLIVSKPRLDCIEAICDRFSHYKDKILFRFTIGSTHDDTLSFWEPGAPTFQERIFALEFAHEQGFSTSVSCEPMLDQSIEAVVEEVSPYVTDAIWIGKANMLKQRLRINGFRDDAETMARADELLSWQTDTHITALYERLRDNPMVKWKDSVKRVVGIELATEAGLDE